MFYQNIKGLATGNGTAKWEEAINSMNKRKVSVFGFTETNIDWNNHKLTARLKAKLRRHCKHANFSTSTSTAKLRTDYKPVGTATIAIKQWAGRVTGSIHDKSGQGRWSGLQLRGNNSDIIIITGYRVSQNAIEQVGAKTAYAQEWSIARQHGINNAEPRSQFISDLIKEIKKWQDERKEIILMLDANEQAGTEQEGLGKLTTSCNLTDIHAMKTEQRPR